MSNRRTKNGKGRITAGGNIPRPGQKHQPVIVLTQPKRFGIDTSDFMQAICAAENVDYSLRSKLYDLYSDIMMDSHLTCVIEKRKNAVLCSAIEFRRNGKPDDRVNEQIHSPWFSHCIADLLDARFWGFSLLQFYRDGEWVGYDLIPRKHVDPVRRLILQRQTDITGTSWDEYPDLLFAGSEDDLGLLAKAAPWVIYKRNTTGDWAQFSEIFGMPIQEYTYETDDEESRRRALEDANSLGALATFIHGKDTDLKLLEAGNKSGSAEVYEKFCEQCNKEISKLILGNTLTTESSENGTQALGTVHKKVEDKVAQSDRLYILDILNYEMTDIFTSMGIDTQGGKFCFTEQKDVDMNTKVSILTQLSTHFNLPVDDDWLYKEFGIEKPKNYEAQKSAKEQQRIEREQKEQEAMQTALPPQPDVDKDKKGFKNWLRSFFAHAPSKHGADLEW
jgi:phage gp29-like protein